MYKKPLILALLISLIFLSILIIILLATQNQKISDIVQLETPLKVGQKAFLFESLSSDGKKTTIKGKNTFLYFYKPNCAACKNELPVILENYHKLKSNGIHVIGISTENLTDTKRFIKKNNIEFPIIPDPEKKIFWKYRIRFVPLIVMVDKSGIICFYQQHGQSIQEILSEVNNCFDLPKN